ncbi:tetratricopeptide repeat protein [Pseudomonas sp. TE3610]
MNKTKCRSCFALVPLLVTTFSLAAHANPAQTQCPSQNFNQFLTAFSTNTTLQSNYHQHYIRKLTLLKSPSGPLLPYQPMVDSRALHYPLMPAAEPSVTSVVISPDGNSATYTDKRGGLGNIKIYTFQHSNTCWLLSGIEDWSVRDAQLTLPDRPGMSPVEQRCAARADLYGQLGGPERYPLTAEFFQASMDYLVCAAASGDPESSYGAAGLGLSGMAAYPGYAETERLFKAAAKTIPDATLVLATFYCNGGDTPREGACVAPQKAQGVLEAAAMSGSARGLHDLAEALGAGDLIAMNPPRALACYRAALQAGEAEAQASIDRLLSRGVKDDASAPCLTANP